MRQLSEELFKDVAVEVSLFYEKLKEQCLAERESLVARIEANEEHDSVMQDYAEDAHEFIVDIMTSEDKEMLSDILNHFKEQIDSRLAEIDGGITRNLQKDWQDCEKKLNDDQHARNRNIIMEIIATKKKFKDNVNKKFEDWRVEDEND